MTLKISNISLFLAYVSPIDLKFIVFLNPTLKGSKLFLFGRWEGNAVAPRRPMVFIHLAWSRPLPCLPPSLAFLHFLNYGCDPYLSYFHNKQSIAGKDETKSTLCTKRSFIFLMFYLIRVLRLWFQWGESTVQLKRRLKSLKNKLASTKKRKKMKSQ